MINLKYANQYLILPAEDGSRADTKLAVECSDSFVEELLERGYITCKRKRFSEAYRQC